MYLLNKKRDQMKRLFLITVFFCVNIISYVNAQDFSIQIVDAYMIDSIPIYDSYKSSTIIESNTLSYNQTFLIITGIIQPKQELKSSVEISEITFTSDKEIKPIGQIRNDGTLDLLGNVSFRIFSSKTLFTCAFVVSKNTNKGVLKIKNINSEIKKITTKNIFEIEKPTIKINKVSYLSQLRLPMMYNSTNDNYFRVITPKKGRILKLDIIIITPTQRYGLEHDYYGISDKQLSVLDENNLEFSCLGHEGRNGNLGHYSLAMQRNCSINEKIETFYFIVNKESKFKLLSFGEGICEF